MEFGRNAAAKSKKVDKNRKKDIILLSAAAYAAVPSKMPARAGLFAVADPRRRYAQTGTALFTF